MELFPTDEKGNMDLAHLGKWAQVAANFVDSKRLRAGRKGSINAMKEKLAPAQDGVSTVALPQIE